MYCTNITSNQLDSTVPVLILLLDNFSSTQLSYVMLQGCHQEGDRQELPQTGGQVASRHVQVGAVYTVLHR